MSPWQALESLGELLGIVDDRFRVVRIKEPLLDQAKPGVNPVGHYCYSVLFGRSSPCDGRCPVKPVLTHGRPCSVEPRCEWLPLRETRGGADWWRLFEQRCEKPLKKVIDDGK